MAFARRIAQVGYFMWPRWRPADVAWVATQLNPGQLALFLTMRTADRAHAVRVARRLDARGAPPTVLEAALLHDCGKPADYGLVSRILGVLLARRGTRLLATPPAKGLRRALQIYAWHDAYGLELAKATGTSAEALALLAAYGSSQVEGPQPWLGPFIECDDLG